MRYVVSLPIAATKLSRSDYAMTAALVDCKPINMQRSGVINKPSVALRM